MSKKGLSSITKKLIMAISGAGLVFFLLFHGAMNVVSIFSEDAYRWICEFLGANWYAIVGSIGLGILMVVHIVYAFIISFQNYRARGSQRYAVNERPEGVMGIEKHARIRRFHPVWTRFSSLRLLGKDAARRDKR